METAIRVLVVDDHEVFAEALGLLLDRRPGIETMEFASTGEEALERCRTEAPDVVLMDLDLPGMSGIEAIARLRRLRPDTKIVAVTALQDARAILSALEAGACGFVPKTRAPDDLVGIVRRAAEGELIMRPVDIRSVVEQLRGTGVTVSESEVALARLTSREMQTLLALAEGKSTGEVAEALGIARLTVQSYVKSILAKLGVHSKVEAVTIAWRHGLVPDTRSA